jgi:outer membrane lipopolysaccharide assembly protein LptE/RlpB
MAECKIDAFERPDSSSIGFVSYNFQSEELKVIFKSGSVYEYTSVPKIVYSVLKNSESIGTSFNATVRSKYPYTRK